MVGYDRMIRQRGVGWHRTRWGRIADLQMTTLQHRVTIMYR